MINFWAENTVHQGALFQFIIPESQEDILSQTKV